MHPFEKLFSQATDAQQFAGRTWYDVAHEHARQLSQHHNTTTAQAAAVIAALSPRCRWTLNLQLADDFLAGRPVLATFNNSIKAAQLARTNPATLPGPKCSDFFNCIIDPHNDYDVVIDAHMMRAALGYVPNFAPRKQTRTYQVLANQIRTLAAKADILPLQYQAVVWCCLTN